MSMLKNPRHEAFAQAMARGFSSARAYEHAGYKPDTAHASRLAATMAVWTRVQELKQLQTDVSGITKAWVLSKLVQSIENTSNPEADTYNPSAANRSLELVGKELGMFIDRTEVGKPGDFDRLNDDELSTLLVAELAAQRDTSRPAAGRGAEAEVCASKPH